MQTALFTPKALNFSVGDVVKRADLVAKVRALGLLEFAEFPVVTREFGTT